MTEKLFIRNAELGERLYRALDVLPFLPGEIEQKIQLGVTLEDLTAPEYWFLRRGSLLCASAIIPAPGAGNFAGMQLNGPAVAGGSLAVIEQVVIINSNAATATFQCGFGIAGGGAVDITPNKRDDRLLSPFTPGAVCAFRPQTFAAAVAPSLGGSPYTTAAAGAQVTQDGPWVTVGNEPFVVRTGNANQSMYCSIFWRERAVQPQER